MTSKAMPAWFTEMIYGFRKSRIVFTALELDLFTIIGQKGDTGASTDDVALKAKAAPRAIRMMKEGILCFTCTTDKIYSMHLPPERNGEWMKQQRS